MMRRVLTVLVAAGFALGVPALAAANGTEKAAARIQAAMEKHTEVLSRVLEKVPEAARASIESARDAAIKGQETALAALGGVHGETAARPAASGVGTAAPDAAAEGKPDVTGLQKARESVAAGFEKSVAALNNVIARVPEGTQEKILAALARVGEHRQVALANLDLLIGGEHPGPMAASVRPDRPDRPGRPDRPERPERPERPDVPDRPDLPAIPDRPERPEVPAPIH